MSNHITENQPIDLYGHYWGQFSNFWTDSVPTFFTETVGTSFQTTAQSINEYIQPFFNDSTIWIEGNANWLWPVAMVIVASAALITGFVIGCLFSKKAGEPKDPQNLTQTSNQQLNDSDNPIEGEEKTEKTDSRATDLQYQPDSLRHQGAEPPKEDVQHKPVIGYLKGLSGQCDPDFSQTLMTQLAKGKTP